ncbi:mCG148032 [Mus musculus]|nr:mCG148032 [Mus musculus]
MLSRYYRGLRLALPESRAPCWPNNSSLECEVHGISLLNSKVKTMRTAVLQDLMALDVLTAARGGTCAIIRVLCI